MVIRPLTAADLTFINDIDATIDATQYLHDDSSGEGLARSWRLQQRA